MNRTIATLAAGVIATAFAITPAAAQNLPPPGNLNPGSMNSGAEESGAEDQPRSYGPYYSAPRADYGQGYNAYGYDAYVPQRGMSYGPFGYAPGYGPYDRGTGGAAAIGANN